MTKIEIKEEDIKVIPVSSGNATVMRFGLKFKNHIDLEQLKQQILQDHEDAKNHDKLLSDYKIRGQKIHELVSENQRLKYERVDLIVELRKDRQIVKKLEELDFGVLLQSLRDDFSEDKDHVPNDILKKMIKNTETMMNIQILEGKK